MAELLDHRGQPIDTAALRAERAGPTVGGVRSVWPAYQVRNLTPGRLAPLLRQAEVPGHGNIEHYVELAETMEEVDLHYAGVLQTRKLQVSQLPILVEPASDSAADLADADLVSDFFARRRLADECRDILDAIGKGFSVTEIIWEMSERQWMPVRLEYRLPRWFDFDPVGGRQLLLRDEAGGWAPLADTPYKYITATITAKSGLPIRGGLARLVAWAWLFKNYTLKDWVRFVEAYGQPLRLGKFGPAATQADKDTLYRAVRNIATDAAAIIPEGMAIEFVDGITFQARAEVYLELLRYLDSQVSIAVLGQTLTTQSGESGSYSLGQVHNEVRRDIEQSDADRLAEVLERDLVVPMVTLNHGPRRRYPRLVIERTDSMDAKLLAESLERLVPMGLRVRADEVRTALNLTAPEDGDEVLRPPGAAAPEDEDEDEEEQDEDEEDRMAALAQAHGEPDTPALATETLRQRVGPLTDGWVDTLRAALTTTEWTPEMFAGWLDDIPATLELDPVVEVLGEALSAVWLAGRFDVAEFSLDDELRATASAQPALAAEPSADSAQLPFADQITFFRRKVNVPTRAWTDLWQAQHDVAFVVAGALRDELLSDLRGAVSAAMADGTTLETFRREFDTIIARHGWSYNGGRDWRTRVIYETNLRTSYSAGRYAQLQAVKARRPYWRYRHSGSENPRLHHKAWDGLVLHADDPWWHTHAPTNGWGCGCYLDALSARDLARLGKRGPDQAPPIKYRTVTVGTRGPSPRTVHVPEGVDPGFAYTPGRESLPGQAAQRRLLQGITQAPHLAAGGVRGLLDTPRIMAAHEEVWNRWRRQVGARGADKAETFVLTAMDRRTQQWLAEHKRTLIASAAVTITRRQLAHAERQKKAARGQGLDEEDWARLPATVHHPDAILYDNQNPGLLYVFSPARDTRKGKVVVRLNFSDKVKIKDRNRERITTNAVRTGGYVGRYNLEEPHLELISGKIE